MRKLAAPILILFILANVSAFEAELQPVERTATPDKPAEFKLNIQNTEFEERSFRISSVTSTPSYWISYKNSKTVPAHGNTSFSVKITPPENSIQQNYLFQLTVRSGEETEKVEDFFSFSRQNDILFRSVKLSSTSLKPGETLEADLELLNTASSEVKNYQIRLKTGYGTKTVKGPEIESEQVVATTLSTEIPGNASPGNEEAEVSIQRGNRTRSSVTQSFAVQKVTEVEKQTEIDNRLLFIKERLSATNAGNHPTTASFNRTVPDYLAPITRLSPEPDAVIDRGGEKVYSWNITFSPGETVSVELRTDYWIPLTALAVIFAALIAWKKLKTSLKFTKSCQAEDGEIKIRIELENLSDTSEESIKVKDFVPDIAEVIDEFEMAEPELRETSNGTKLEWDIGELEPGDQRVLEYRIKPALKVEEGVNLPRAELESDQLKIAETEEPETEFDPRET